MSNLRFNMPVSSARPRGARVIETYSLKLRRRIQCFGEPAYCQWIRPETDPSVDGFCERPVVIEWDNGSRRPADFWVRRGEFEELIVMEEGEAPRTCP